MLSILGVLGATQLTFGGKDPVKGDEWYHEMITRKAAATPPAQTAPAVGAGWAGTGEHTDTTSASAALAWHADFVDSYLYNPLWWAGGGLPRFRSALVHQRELTKLHFDDLNSTRQIEIMWTRYQAGTVAGLLWAAERNDVAAARNIVGTGLHALQDFYSHSNWVDDEVRSRYHWDSPANPDLPDRHSLHLFTGTYEENEAAAFAHHGKYSLACSIMAKLPAALMNAVCSPYSPLSTSSMCRQWRACQDAASPGGTQEVAGVTIPEGIIYIEPVGIALDSPWMAQLSMQQRTLTPAGRSISAEELFELARSRAEEHSRAWLQRLTATMEAAGLAGFWSEVRQQERAGTPAPPIPGELGEALTSYPDDLAQFEQTWRAPFEFLSAGAYPPPPDGSAEGWYLRLELSTGQDTFAGTGTGTDSDIDAVVDGRTFRLDRMRERTPEGGLGDFRLLEHNDFERGSRDSYVLGPFPQRPGSLVLRNNATHAVDVVRAAWADFTRIASDVVDDVLDVLLTLIGGHADYIGTQKVTASWSELSAIAAQGPRPLRLHVDGRAEGVYTLSGRLSAIPTAGGLRASVELDTLRCDRESTIDQAPGLYDDEPFLITLLSSPAAGQSLPWLSPVFTRVDSGESRAIRYRAQVDVPRYGGLVFAVQMWENDSESSDERRRLRDDFARGYDERTINERSRLLDAIGTVIAPDWQLAAIDVCAFLRTADAAEYARMITQRPIDRWIAAGASLQVPFDAITTHRAIIPAVPGRSAPEIDLMTLAAAGRWASARLSDTLGNTAEMAELPFDGNDGDARGFVRRHVLRTEDGQDVLALWTHPRWVQQGTIKGWLPDVTLPAGARLQASVGFRQGAAGSDGVRFMVFEHHTLDDGRRTWNAVIDHHKSYTGSLDHLSADLSHLAGRAVGIELRVDAA
ncbi:hypothetical protein GTQ99_21200, partial [Kineococcus sp. T13]|uniref:hypothetical protein n=1 Tax=Kineococcus vitellinus TaxID=2696565 RepID=UPI001412395F